MKKIQIFVKKVIACDISPVLMFQLFSYTGIVGDTDRLPTSGVLTSPNYPDRYPHNYDSTQIIQVAEGNTIRFAWTNFDTERGDDYVRIQDENGTDLLPIVDMSIMSYAQISGSGKLGAPPDWTNVLPPPGVTNSNIMQVKFSSNWRFAFTGWRLEWNEIKNDSKNYNLFLFSKF